MKAEIVTIGTELLLGQIVDTNAAYLSQILAAQGVDLYYRTTVGDNVQRIAGVIDEALRRCDLVITSGGLGPTVDDVTREAVALAAGRGLEFSSTAWQAVETMFARWGRAPDENNRRQAMLPAGSEMIANPVGTAPAFVLETERGTVISLPGVPREMKYLTEHALVPYLRRRLGDQPPVIKSRVLRTVGIGESNVDTAIADLETGANPTVGLSAHPGQTDIRITAKAASEAEAEALIGPLESEIRRRLERYIFGTDEESLEEVVARLLVQTNHSLGLVESNTGGAIASWIQATPFRAALSRSMVVGDAAGLVAELGLSADLAADPWPSDALALAAAEAQRSAGADYGLAILGTMDTQESLYSDNRGFSYAALVHPAGRIVRRYDLGGMGEVTQRWIGNRVLEMLRRLLLNLDGSAQT